MSDDDDENKKNRNNDNSVPTDVIMDQQELLEQNLYEAVRH